LGATATFVTQPCLLFRRLPVGAAGYGTKRRDLQSVRPSTTARSQLGNPDSQSGLGSLRYELVASVGHSDPRSALPHTLPAARAPSPYFITDANGTPRAGRIFGDYE